MFAINIYKRFFFFFLLFEKKNPLKVFNKTQQQKAFYFKIYIPLDFWYAKRKDKPRRELLLLLLLIE